MRGKGFTLIELIIVIAIMAAFMALVLPRFFNFNKGQDLQNEAENLKASLRTAQNNANSGVNKCSSGLRSSSWSVKFLERSSDHVIYYQMVELCSDGSIVTYQPHYLTNDVTIDSVELNSCPGIDLKTDNPQILFTNVSGDVTFSHTLAGGCPITSSTKLLTINLKSGADPTNPLKVNVDKGGSIFVSSE